MNAKEITRVLLVSPVPLSAAESATRLARYREVLPADRGFELTLEALDPTGAEELPPRLNTREDIAAVDGAYARRLAAALAAAGPTDRVMPDCMLDPGTSEIDDVRLTGVFHLVARELRRNGRVVVVVSRNRAGADALAELVTRYGIAEQVQDVVSLEIGPEHAFDHDSWLDAIAAVGPDVEVLAACTGMVFDTEDPRAVRVLTPYDLLRVVEPQA